LAVSGLVVAVLAIVMVLRLAGRSADVSSGGARSADLERRVSQAVQRLEVVEQEIDASRHGDASGHPVAGAVRNPGTAISHIGLVRFDAFDDTGGGQSFALALIDEDGDGVVLSSLHSRQATRVYIKGIRRGVADSPLSGEEVKAMQNAGIAPTV
jgi:hypothetical protein